MRGRVRLHGGGISPAEVRLRGPGASERKTAPGKDIRDIGPEVPRRCRSCGGRGYAPLRECGACLEDLQIIREVTDLLRKHRQPPLSKDPGPRSGYRKARNRGTQAEGRINKRRRQNGLQPRTGRRAGPPTTKGAPKKASPRDKACQTCFTQKSKLISPEHNPSPFVTELINDGLVRDLGPRPVATPAPGAGSGCSARDQVAPAVSGGAAPSRRALTRAIPCPCRGRDRA